MAGVPRNVSWVGMKAQNQSRLTKKQITSQVVSGIIPRNVEHILWQVYLEMLTGYI